MDKAQRKNDGYNFFAKQEKIMNMGCVLALCLFTSGPYREHM